MKSFDVSVRGVYSPCLILSTSGAYLSLILSVALPDDGVVFCFLVCPIFFFLSKAIDHAEKTDAHALLHPDFDTSHLPSGHRCGELGRSRLEMSCVWGLLL